MQQGLLCFALNCSSAGKYNSAGFAICSPVLLGISSCGGRWVAFPAFPLLMPVLFVPRFPSPGGGCTTPARASPAWPAYGPLPANSSVYQTSGKKMSSFSRSCSALERATWCSLFLVIVMSKVLARGNPSPYFPASPTLQLKMRHCAVVAKLFRRDSWWELLSFWGEQNEVC